MARQLRTITAGALMEQLADLDPDTLVIFTADYGDHCHTSQALPIQGVGDVVTIQESGYSNSGWAIRDEDEERDEEDEEELTAAEKVEYVVIN